MFPFPGLWEVPPILELMLLHGNPILGHEEARWQCSMAPVFVGVKILSESVNGSGLYIVDSHAKSELR